MYQVCCIVLSHDVSSTCRRVLKAEGDEARHVPRSAQVIRPAVEIARTSLHTRPIIACLRQQYPPRAISLDCIRFVQPGSRHKGSASAGSIALSDNDLSRTFDTPAARNVPH